MATSITHRAPERTNRLILIGAIALAFLAAVLVFFALSNFGSGGDNSAVVSGTTNVVTATRDIEAGAQIASDMLQISAVSTSQILDGSISDISAVTGLTIRYPVQKGEQVTSAKIGQSAAGEQVFAGVIPPGKRAVAIPVTEETSVGGLIVAGDRVDITAVINGNNAQGQDQAATLLQNVEVLAVAQTTQKPTVRLDSNGKPVDEVGTRPEDTDAKPKAKTITVAVNPQDVAIVALAQESGTIFLSLRPFGDESTAPGIDAPRSLPKDAPTPSAE